MNPDVAFMEFALGGRTFRVRLLNDDRGEGGGLQRASTLFVTEGDGDTIAPMWAQLTILHELARRHLIDTFAPRLSGALPPHGKPN